MGVVTDGIRLRGHTGHMNKELASSPPDYTDGSKAHQLHQGATHETGIQARGHTSCRGIHVHHHHSPVGPERSGWPPSWIGPNLSGSASRAEAFNDRFNSERRNRISASASERISSRRVDSCSAKQELMNCPPQRGHVAAWASGIGVLHGWWCAFGTGLGGLGCIFHFEHLFPGLWHASHSPVADHVLTNIESERQLSNTSRRLN